MERLLHLASTVAFLILCAVGAALGIKLLLSSPPPPPPAAVVAGARPPIPLYQPGEAIQVGGIDFGSVDRTVLLVVQKGCSFCEQSMPFYQRLGADKTLAGRTRLVAIAPDDEATSRQELERYGVRVDQIVQSSLRQLKVRGTPTAIIVSRRGVIERILPGRLDDAQQEDLVSFLKAGL